MVATRPRVSTTRSLWRRPGGGGAGSSPATDLTVAWSSYVDEEGGPATFAPAVAIATQGNAVLLVSQVLSLEPGPDSDAVKAVTAAIEDNLPLVCEVASGC